LLSPRADRRAVRSGDPARRVVWLGADLDELRALKGVEIVDLQGRRLTPGLIDDIAFLDPVIGVGEVATSDHRSSLPTLAELLRIASDAHVAVLKGTDVDQPRNPAKSVTVE
jgi:hypothetical protein